MRLSVQIEFDKTLDLVTHKNTVIVGRSPKADLVIPHDGISRQHCKIEFTTDKSFFITDLGSSNGVFFNGVRIPPQSRRQVKPGVQLAIGGLQCELSAFIPLVTEDTKVIKSTIEKSEAGEFTSTIRIARIDLNQPNMTLELEKKQTTSKRPRNPISGKIEKTEEPDKKPNRLIMIVAALIVLALAWYFGGKK